MHKKFIASIGLEIHCELNTQSKIFCSCANCFGAPPNSLCCPVCTGLPGAVPVLNQQVVKYAVQMGHALQCSINACSLMERKHYYYPDLPKGYQISQNKVPLCVNGFLDIYIDDAMKRIRIKQIHIEEDAGKLLHSQEGTKTFIDYNRCGVPLIEIVSEPDMHSAQDAKIFMDSIVQILLYLGISQAKMQEGNIRADVNVSISEHDSDELGVRVEMKNINSFAAVYRAIEWEIERQEKILASGGVVYPETRRWNDSKGYSTVLRKKDDALDYRFLPDPDLGWLEISHAYIKELLCTIPELPLAKQLRFSKEYALSMYDATLLTETIVRADFYEKAAALSLCSPKNLANWMLVDLQMILHDTGKELHETKLTPQNFAELVYMVETGVISGSNGKRVLAILLEESVAPLEVMKKNNWEQLHDENYLSQLVNSVVQANPKAVKDYQNGKKKALGFLTGQCMKQSNGRANPELIQSLIDEKIYSM